jgi:N-carbamoyl-L-amino-acid hydrolase
VLIFENEEGGTIGSHAITDGIPAAELEQTSQSGKTFGKGFRFLGGDPDRLASARRSKGDIAAYLELHIEQGGRLDQAGIPIGVVLGIVGIRHWEVTVEGFRQSRRDHADEGPAGRSARRGAVHRRRQPHRDQRAGPQVGTVGKIRVEPGAYNVIPGKAIFGLELRELDDAKTLGFYRRIRAECERLARVGGCTIAFQETLASLPALTDPRSGAPSPRPPGDWGSPRWSCRAGRGMTRRRWPGSDRWG